MEKVETKSKALFYIAKKNDFAVETHPDSFNSKGDMIQPDASPGSPRAKSIVDSRRMEGSSRGLPKKLESQVQKLFRKRGVQHIDVTRMISGKYFSQPGSKLQTPVRSAQLSPKRNLTMIRNPAKSTPQKRNSAVFHEALRLKLEGNALGDVQFTENSNRDGPFMKYEDWRKVNKLTQMNLSYKLNRRKFRSTQVSVMKENQTVLSPHIRQDSHDKLMLHRTAMSSNYLKGLSSQCSFSNEASPALSAGLPPTDLKTTGIGYILKTKKQLNALAGLTKNDKTKSGHVASQSRAEHTWQWKGKHNGGPSNNKSAFT